MEDRGKGQCTGNRKSGTRQENPGMMWQLVEKYDTPYNQSDAAVLRCTISSSDGATQPIVKYVTCYVTCSTLQLHMLHFSQGPCGRTRVTTTTTAATPHLLHCCGPACAGVHKHLGGAPSHASAPRLPRDLHIRHSTSNCCMALSLFQFNDRADELSNWPGHCQSEACLYCLYSCPGTTLN